MKYCVTFNSNFRYLREVDEIILPWSKLSKNAETQLANFIKSSFNKEQRIIIQPDFHLDIPEVNAILKLFYEGWNLALKIGKNDKLNPGLECIPFFYNEYPTTIEEVYAQAEEKVSDIYITESLGFRLKDLQNITNKYGIKIRVIPNIAQCAPAARTYINSMQKFWIRPEDTEIYEGYVDVFELTGGQDNSRLSVVYEIYKQQQWLGSLNDLILDFGDAIVVPNTGMNPHFASMRLNCGKACLYSSCNVCPQMGTLAQSFNEVGLEVIKPRKKTEKTEEEKEKILNKLGEKYGLRANEEIVLPE